MVVQSSLALDVIEVINMPNLKPTPSYLSEDDAVTVDMFMQSEYARDYMIDMSNIHWGGKYIKATSLTFMLCLAPRRIW